MINSETAREMTMAALNFNIDTVIDDLFLNRIKERAMDGFNDIMVRITESRFLVEMIVDRLKELGYKVEVIECEGYVHEVEELVVSSIFIEW